MVSPLPSMVVIECPHCGTRYQLAADTLGNKRRKVACASCGGTWQAEARKAMPVPPPPSEAESDKLFDDATEQALDDAFEAEAQGVAPKTDDMSAAKDRTIAAIRAVVGNGPAEADADEPPAIRGRIDSKTEQKLRKQLKDFARRQNTVTRKLPQARVRRAARLVGISLLVALIVCGVALRTQIVRQFPDLAGVYDAVGLGVNVVGLEFRDVTTVMSLHNGANVMKVDARIYSVAAREVGVPPVLVTLLDGKGAALYQWSVEPEVTTLEPGEVVDFTTQLTSPPAGGAGVRLQFTDGSARTSDVQATPAPIAAPIEGH